MPAHLAQTPQRRPLELGISNCRYRGLLVVVLQAFADSVQIVGQDPKPGVAIVAVESFVRTTVESMC